MLLCSLACGHAITYSSYFLSLDGFDELFVVAELQPGGVVEVPFFCRFFGNRAILAITAPRLRFSVNCGAFSAI